MYRRDFFQKVPLLASMAQASAAGAEAKRGGAGSFERARLASEFTVLYESPTPATVYASSPGLARLPSGRLVATMDYDGDYMSLQPKTRTTKWLCRGKIFTSDDRGRTWKYRTEIPVEHARPFSAGNSLYVLGQSGDLIILRSEDSGDTWSQPVALTENEHWHAAPCNVHYSRDRVYLVMERHTDPSGDRPAAQLAPVLMSGRIQDDLTRRSAWVFSNQLSFREAVLREGPPHLLGVPFFKEGPTTPNNPGDHRLMPPLGWLETNVVQFTDPDHVWHDPTGRTFHLWMRAQTGTTNLACLAKAVESGDARTITVSLERAPSGESMLYVPCPGGQMKFHILFDEVTRLFWLLSTQSTDSMTRPERLPPERFNLPNNERQRLALHFSKNCVDWCFAGLVADGGHPKQSRHYASMVIDGKDLHILSRSGDARAKSAHDNNLITFHTVKSFRDLIY